MNSIAEIDRLLESSEAGTSSQLNSRHTELKTFNDTLPIYNNPTINDFDPNNYRDVDDDDYLDNESVSEEPEEPPIQKPISTDGFSQTDPGQKLMFSNAGFSKKNVHNGFDYDEFNRRIIFKVIQEDATIGDHLKEMCFDFEQADRDALEYFRKIICTIDDMKFSNNIEVKNCHMLIELFRSIVKMAIPEEYDSICEQIDIVQESIRNTDYTISIINEVASMKMEDLLSTRTQPIKRTVMLLGQTLISIFVKKAPKIMQSMSDKYYNKRKADEPISAPFAKKGKF